MRGMLRLREILLRGIASSATKSNNEGCLQKISLSICTPNKSVDIVVLHTIYHPETMASPLPAETEGDIPHGLGGYCSLYA